MGLFDFIKEKREEAQRNYADYVKAKLNLEKGMPLDSGAPYRQCVTGKLRSFEFETEEEAAKTIEILKNDYTFEKKYCKKMLKH